MIRIQHLHKSYNKGKANELHVLNDVTLVLPEHGMVAVFGRSGCGKTTLLNVTGGLDRFDSGSVEIFGEDVRKDTDTLRNRMIGYIFQNYNLNKDENCFDNVADALRLCGMTDEEEIRTRVLAALKNVGMDKYVRRLPDTLSGGQQQRIAIARAIVKNPPVILADEPTGNLDEANTIHIMELLRQIAQDHLVVLVTHEAKLVDYYCDRVVEISDGRIVNVQELEAGADYAGGASNDIYLGGMPRSDSENERVSVSYYGEDPAAPIRLKVINRDGRMFLRVETPGVHIVDDSGEIRLHEGVYEQKKVNEERQSRIDMGELPAFEGKNYGRLFTFGSSLKSGYEANFKKTEKKRKRTKGLLRVTMILLAAAFVVLAAHFGTSLRDYAEAEGKYHKNLIYVYTPNASVTERLNKAAADPANGISDYWLVGRNETLGYLPEHPVNIGNFESFQRSQWFSDYSATGVMVPWKEIGERRVLAGKAEGLATKDVVISSRVADGLLKSSAYGYIRSYGDLINLQLRPSSGGYLIDSDGMLRIAGVVQDDTPTLYVSDIRIAANINTDLLVLPGSLCPVQPPPGQTVLVMQSEPYLGRLPEAGETVVCRGVELTVAEVKDFRVRHADPEDGAFTWTDPDYQIHDSAYDEYWDGVYFGEYYFIVNDSDYVRIGKEMGRTDKILNINYYYAYEDEEKEGADPSQVFFRSPYTAVYASDPEAAQRYLFSGVFDDLDTGQVYYKEIVSPSVLRAQAFSDNAEDIRNGIIGMTVMIGLIGLCMYFIMRSSMMNRVKEIGIYRAVGVSRGNLLFRFSVESLVLTALTVFPGYLIASLIMRHWLTTSLLMGHTFYYPLWISLGVLLILLLLCLVFGTLPIMLLLKKTPSEILAKYDI